MRLVKNSLLRIVFLSLALVVGGFSFGYFSSRPPLTIDPATLARDGSALNYCELSILDGSTTHMNRICKLPEAHKVPTPRGRRYEFFRGWPAQIQQITLGS